MDAYMCRISRTDMHVRGRRSRGQHGASTRQPGGGIYIIYIYINMYINIYMHIYILYTHVFT